MWTRIMWSQWVYKKQILTLNRRWRWKSWPWRMCCSLAVDEAAVCDFGGSGGRAAEPWWRSSGRPEWWDPRRHYPSDKGTCPRSWGNRARCLLDCWPARCGRTLFCCLVCFVCRPADSCCFRRSRPRWWPRVSAQNPSQTQCSSMWSRCFLASFWQDWSLSVCFLTGRGRLETTAMIASLN